MYLINFRIFIKNMNYFVYQDDENFKKIYQKIIDLKKI